VAKLEVHAAVDCCCRLPLLLPTADGRCCCFREHSETWMIAAMIHQMRGASAVHYTGAGVIAKHFWKCERHWFHEADPERSKLQLRLCDVLGTLRT